MLLYQSTKLNAKLPIIQSNSYKHLRMLNQWIMIYIKLLNINIKLLQLLKSPSLDYNEVKVHPILKFCFTEISQNKKSTILGFSSFSVKRRFHQPTVLRRVFTRLLQISWNLCCCSVVLQKNFPLHYKQVFIVNRNISSSQI